jgi:hypothetical protein
MGRSAALTRAEAVAAVVASATVNNTRRAVVDTEILFIAILPRTGFDGGSFRQSHEALHSNVVGRNLESDVSGAKKTTVAKRTRDVILGRQFSKISEIISGISELVRYLGAAMKVRLECVRGQVPITAP